MTERSSVFPTSSSKRQVIRPGFGSDDLHLGQTKHDVLTLLGKPEGTTRKYKGQYFLNYPAQGLQVDLGKANGRVKYLYFFRSGVRGNRAATIVTDRGIRLGDTQQAVLKRLGEPQEKGKGVVITPRIRLGDWFHYARGITFEFGDDGRIDMITLGKRGKETKDQ